MSKHTPGPWSVFESTSPYLYPGIEAKDAALSVVIFGDDEEDEKGVRGNTPEEAMANAHLIAAAPDMLAFMKRCRHFSGLSSATHSDIEDIIFRAEGRPL